MQQLLLWGELLKEIRGIELFHALAIYRRKPDSSATIHLKPDTRECTYFPHRAQANTIYAARMSFHN